MRGAVLILLSAVAACAPSGERAVNETGTENAAEAPPPAAPPVPAPPPEMGAVSRADILAELEPGSGCSLVRDGKNLLVAAEGDAIAKPNGTTLHFEFDGGIQGLFRGGAFTASGISITVEPAEEGGYTIDELVVRPAMATVVHENGARDRFEAEWQCGS